MNKIQKYLMANYWLQQAIKEIKQDLEMDENTMRYVISMILCEQYVERATLDNLWMWNT